MSLVSTARRHACPRLRVLPCLLFLIGLGSIYLPPAHADVTVYAGYADNSLPTQNFPSPWQSSPHTLFLGDAGPTYNAGAFLLHNDGPGNVTLSPGAFVDGLANTPAFPLWDTLIGTGVTLHPGDNLILTQTAPGNFATAALSGTPALHLTLNGIQRTFPDTAQVLTTGGINLASLGLSSALQWRPLGTTGLNAPEGTGVAPINVLTAHNDTARTGADLNETLLTPTTVNVNSFGLRFSYAVDGQVYAQPLYLSNVTLPDSSVHNIVFVATEHDSLYAFDADNPGTGGGLLWQRSFLDPTNGVAPVPPIVLKLIGPEMGITSTPVIDPMTNTIYVEAYTQETSPIDGSVTYVHRLHALDLTTGQDKPNSPVVITASCNGSGDGSQNGSVTFNALYQHNRVALLLSNGVLYFAFGSENDAPPYHGWVFAYDAQTLQKLGCFNTTPNGKTYTQNGHTTVGGGGIWQGGSGLATDPSGSLYFSVGNGTFDADPSLGGGQDFGDCLLKLRLGNDLSVQDYFTPFDQDYLNQNDIDLGSGGVVVLPDTVGSASHPHLLVGGGKEGTIYLLDRDNLGHFQAGSDSQIVQSLPLAVASIRCVPAYFAGSLYYVGKNDVPKQFTLANAQLSLTPTSQASETYAYPGATPSVSASGQTNGIVWTVLPGGVGGLYAYDAANLSHELYNSYQAAHGRDTLGKPVKFEVPTIANGKVYVGTQTGLMVYGLSIDVTAPTTTASATGSQGNNGWYTSSVQVSLSATDPDGSGDVASRFYSVDGSTPQTYGGQAFPVSGDGVHTLRWWSADQTGNTETQRQGSLKIDSTPPTTTVTLSGLQIGPNTYVGPVTIQIAATDNLSGLATTRYTLDGSSPQAYNQTVLALSIGIHTITYWSVDKAGNVEGERHNSFQISPGNLLPVPSQNPAPGRPAPAPHAPPQRR